MAEKTSARGAEQAGSAANPDRQAEQRRAARERYALEINDPAPVEDVSQVWRTAAQVATIGMFVLALLIALELSRGLLLPVISAFVIGLMLGPLSNRARLLGIPSLVAAIALWLLVVGVFYGVIVLLATPAIDWIAKAPEIGRSIQDKLQVLDKPLAALSDLRKALMPNAGADAKMGFDIVNILQPAVVFVSPAIGQIFIFFGTLLFFLLGRTQLRHVLIFFFEEREARLRMLKIFNDIEHNLTTYLSVVAVINLAVGVAAGVISYFVGLPNAVAWGVLAFILNFIPYVGALIMEATLVAVGLVTFPTLAQALLAPALFLAFTTIEGHFITPGIMGRRLTLNPLTVFLALIFWSWLWGPVGAFLAVPLVIVALVITTHLFPKEDRVLPG